MRILSIPLIYRCITHMSRNSQQMKNHYQLVPIKHFSRLMIKLKGLSDDQIEGTVTAAQANYMRVMIDDGVELVCVVRAILKKIKMQVMVGDKVVVGAVDKVNRSGMIENVYERESKMSDPPVANVNHSVVAFSIVQPDIEPLTLTRFLVEAESVGTPVTLALNKTDLLDSWTQATWNTRIHGWGYVPVFCSAESKLGLDALQSSLKGKTSVIVGPSGVGKSSLINALRNNNHANETILDQRVGEVSTRSGKGKHTTRNVSLLPLLGGGYIADTPGQNKPKLLNVKHQSLSQYFPEIRKKLEESEVTCAFNNCLHAGERDCVVGKDWERYPYYHQLLLEVKEREHKNKITHGTKKYCPTKRVGDLYVPILDIKKHRKQSRKSMKQSTHNDD